MKPYLIALVLVLGLGDAAAALAQNSHASNAAPDTPPGLAVAAQAGHVPVCPGPAAPSDARCHAHVVIDPSGKPLVTNSRIVGYGPVQFQTAYGLTAAAALASTKTIAIVDAYDDPQAEADLNTYSTTFGLPACTTANGCFKKVDQTGGTRYPRGDQGWGLEISLDIEVVHAACPNCKILLVEAASNSFSDLFAAEDYATAHASVVSNSWGGSEFSGETSLSYDGHFNRSGVPITVSSGDSGYGVEFPASSRYVTAVGGTSLKINSNNTRASEAAWSGSGSGCSAYETKPSWQTDAGCARRSVADVSADADPNTGAAIYDSYGYSGQKGWFEVGGTSLSAPLVAAIYALAGNAGSVVYGSYPYTHTAALFDITSGSNGSCGSSYLCTAIAGFDGPTGLGTPSGIAAF
ncbi:MAG: S53 family peptidase [Patescibacteria group bacterium]